ncbi:T9SS type A sorting domain-containing protein [Tenacibaculum jejuense]|uniref:Secretion system C-terminal sorting domain-containing protein n=1 Tax=Tenacibaculum jejuense TaxID=584609 RepID=A0A238UDP9_9FLAO|nr:T9SS type A sorting domain-containing protein [Tenacibaculum jejuense]SNR17146.1 Protein of unknown function precursor containing a C-terminal secretion signal [Tenacibaculum jejuense]
MRSKTTIQFLIAFLFPFIVFSNNFIEKQLPSPDKLYSFYSDPLAKSTIHYGKTPSNFNGEVLLFNHGYIDMNQLFFKNNTFYSDAYRNGYQVVFVGIIKNEDIWMNGELLAESIDIITHKYNIGQLSILAHGHGGKAAEVAMYSFNKNNKVKKVITFGTPFWGTYIADISEQQWFNWIWKKTGLNSKSVTSTTYYCRDIVRPLFDNNPKNEPNKFITIGGSSFDSKEDVTTPSMLTTGSILYFTQGTNDGITPYTSSLRPKSTFVFEKGEFDLNHIDIAFGPFTWDIVQPYLDSKETNTRAVTTSETNDIITSDYQIINSENSYDIIVGDKNTTEVIVDVFHEKNIETFKLFGNDVKLSPISKKKKDDFINDYSSRYLINSKTKLVANSRFAAFVHFPEGPRMSYKAMKNKQSLLVNFEDINIPTEEIEVDAIITKTGNLYGEPISGDSFVYTFSFKPDEKQFALNVDGFNDGVYSIYITGKHPTFIRSIISGFTVGNISLSDVKKEIVEDEITFDIELKTNTIPYNTILLQKKTTEPSKILVKVFNANGQLQFKEILTSFNGNFTFTDDRIASLRSGIYIIDVEQEEFKKSFRVVKE